MASSQFMLKCIGVCLVLVFVSSAALAATLEVPYPYSTIQAAINASVNGDTIIVQPGTYYENINFNGKDIILTSTDPEDPNIVESTIIDGNANGRVVTFTGSETNACELRGFTITNGNAGSGGGIYGGYNNNNMSHATIENCIIINNTVSYFGGGIGGWNGIISNCTIYGNTANNGGGIGRCNGSITNCTISENTAYGDGGGLYYCSGPTRNCTIYGNITYSGYGGGIFANHNGTIANCTIYGNYATRGGGLEDCIAPITNCIIWGNNAPSSGDQLSISSTPTYSCIQDWTGGGTGNISSNPLFVDTSSGNPGEWDLHVLPGSPCIDTGTNMPPGGLPATDIEGFTRPFDGDSDGIPVADMGAYEFSIDPNTPYLHVTSRFFYYFAFAEDENPDPQLLVISNLGKQELNWALDLNDKPDWLIVSPTDGSLEYHESDIVSISVNGIGLSHGCYRYSFKVSDPIAEDSPRLINVEFCVNKQIYVDDDAPNDPGPFDPNVSDPLLDGSAEHPFDNIQEGIDAAIHGDTVLVRRGNYYENINFNGKNIILTSTNPENPNVVDTTIIHGVYHGSVVTFAGTETSDCVLQGFTITKGNTWGSGGGVCGNHSQAMVRNCMIIRNVASWEGGGLALCDGIIDNCTISDNLTDRYCGGGLHLCNGTITNCIITGNSANDSEGGGLNECDGLIANCTIVDNTGYGGGGLYACNGTIVNCIIWDNNLAQVYNSSTPAYSCIQGWRGGGTGNISSDPLFVDTRNDDYHLKSYYGRWYQGTEEYTYVDPNDTPSDPNDDYWVTIPAVPSEWIYDAVTSPCIDAGKPDPNDWYAELWPHGGRINMGAYGGTAQASMSPNPVGNVADLDHDGEVGVLDLLLFSDDWLYAEYLLDTDLNRNGIVDMKDQAQFSAQWLWTEP